MVVRMGHGKFFEIFSQSLKTPENDFLKKRSLPFCQKYLDFNFIFPYVNETTKK